MIQTVEQPYTCVHCGKSFRTEKTLMAHMCEPKRRFLQKDEKRVQVGFIAFNKFYTMVQRSKPKTYEEFCKSSYYNAFVKFGSFVSNINPLYPEKFIDFVIKSNVKLDHWCRDELYDSFLFEIVKVEPVEEAVQRSLQTMMDWAEKHDSSFNHYFRYANLNRAVNDIRNGLISPWMLLLSSSAKDMLSKFNDEQLQIIEPVLDVPYWQRQFKKKPADVELVKEIIKEAGVDA